MVNVGGVSKKKIIVSGLYLLISLKRYGHLNAE